MNTNHMQTEDSMDHDALDLEIDISDWGHDNDSQMYQFNFQGNDDLSTCDQSISSDLSQLNKIQASMNANPGQFPVRKNVIPTITTIYEPKFYEIFQSYQQYLSSHEPDLAQQNIHSQQHLMSYCLNNLLTFSNWARESNTASWIRATLFENPDMRPEVRNGLAMILVYTFATAKADDCRKNLSIETADMFTILMKAESGLGIVNKTSLKIYSDPFGFFNFLKICISGLIDALAIPENERVNIQQTKKTRRGSRNKDEVEAYNYIKNSLVAMFQSPDSLPMAKARIDQILQFWHVRGKGIRNERFSCLFSLPPPDLTNPSSNNFSGGNSVSYSVNPDANLNAPSTDTMSLSGLGLQQLGLNPGTISNRGSGKSNQPASSHSSGAHLNIDASSLNSPHFSNIMNNNSMSQNNANNDNDSVNSDSVSSCSRSPLPSFYNTNPNYFNRNSINTTTSSIPSNVSFNQSASLPQPDMKLLLLEREQQLSRIPIPGLRFDRMGSMTWKGTKIFLYDFNQLPKVTNRTLFFLIDEKIFLQYCKEQLHLNVEGDMNNANNNPNNSSAFPSQMNVQLNFQHMAMGLSSLDRILAKSNSVLTSWNAMEFTQLKMFVEGYKLKRYELQQQQPANQPSNQGPVPPPPTSPAFSIGSSHLSPKASSNTASLFSNMNDPNSRRPLRRRTTGGLEMKRDIARLQQLQEMNMNTKLNSLQLPSSSVSRINSFGPDNSPSVTDNQPIESNKLPPKTPNNYTLIDYWQEMQKQSLSMNNTNPFASFQSTSSGVLVYEQSNEVGLIVRANKKYGIHEDIWCLFYPDESLSQFAEMLSNQQQFRHGMASSLDSSFSMYLMHLLPQLRVLLPNLFPSSPSHPGSVNGMFPYDANNPSSPGNPFSGPITIGYYAHFIDNSAPSDQLVNPLLLLAQSGPPAPPSNASQYRTLGYMTNPFFQITSRFEKDAYFHEIVLL